MKQLLQVILVLGFSVNTFASAASCGEHVQFERINQKIEQSVSDLKSVRLVSQVDILTLKVSCSDNIESFTAKINQFSTMAEQLAQVTLSRSIDSKEKAKVITTASGLNSIASEMLSIAAGALFYK